MVLPWGGTTLGDARAETVGQSAGEMSGDVWRCVVLEHHPSSLPEHSATTAGVPNAVWPRERHVATDDLRPFRVPSMSKLCEAMQLW